jgi:hypothetical protein
MASMDFSCSSIISISVWMVVYSMRLDIMVVCLVCRLWILEVPRKVHLFKKADMGSLNKDIEQDLTRYLEDENIENKTTEDLWQFFKEIITKDYIWDSAIIGYSYGFYGFF